MRSQLGCREFLSSANLAAPILHTQKNSIQIQFIGFLRNNGGSLNGSEPISQRAAVCNITWCARTLLAATFQSSSPSQSKNDGVPEGGMGWVGGAGTPPARRAPLQLRERTTSRDLVSSRLFHFLRFIFFLLSYPYSIISFTVISFLPSFSSPLMCNVYIFDLQIGKIYNTFV